MSESGASGTEEVVTKRAEASFKSGGGRKEREDCNFRGTMGKLLTFRIREAGSMEVKRRTNGRRGDSQAPPGWEGGRRLGCSAGQMGRGEALKSREAGRPGRKTESMALGRDREMRVSCFLLAVPSCAVQGGWNWCGGGARKEQ